MQFSSKDIQLFNEAGINVEDKNYTKDEVERLKIKVTENIVLIRQKNIRELIMYWIRFTKKDAGQQLYQTRLIMQ